MRHMLVLQEGTATVTTVTITAAGCLTITAIGLAFATIATTIINYGEGCHPNGWRLSLESGSWARHSRLCNHCETWLEMDVGHGSLR